MAAAVLLLLLPILAAAPAASTANGEQNTHIKLYWHDVVTGPNLTAVPVGGGVVTNTSRVAFGTVIVTDDPLTEGPDLKSSKLIGRAQGTYTGTGNGKDEVSAMMNMVFVFQTGKYNGSTIAIMGRNAVFTAVREMAVVGGTGVFRWVRGYAQAHTHSLDLKTGYAIVEYNLYIKQ